MYQQVDGYIQPAPAPRFSRTPSSVAHGKHEAVQDTRSVLQGLGVSDNDILALIDQGAIR